MDIGWIFTREWENRKSAKRQRLDSLYIDSREGGGKQIIIINEYTHI